MSAFEHLGTAQAALQSPGISDVQLRQIWIAQPNLRPLVAAHPRVTPRPAAWLASPEAKRLEDTALPESPQTPPAPALPLGHAVVSPSSALTAPSPSELQRTLPRPPIPGVHPVPPPVPWRRSPIVVPSQPTSGAARRGRLGLVVGALIAVAAVAVVVVLVVLPMLRGSAAARYVADYATEPGITQIDLTALANAHPGMGAPTQLPVPGANMLLLVGMAGSEEPMPLVNQVQGVALDRAATAWRVDPDTDWPAGIPPGSLGDFLAGTTRAVLLLVDPADTSQQSLVILDATTGEVVSWRLVGQPGAWRLVFLDDATLVYADRDGGLHAHSATDLDTELWYTTDSLRAGDGAVIATDGILHGKYLVTTGGIREIATGQVVDLVGEPSRSNVFYDDVGRPDGPIVRFEVADQGSARVQGIDLGAKRTTWELSVDSDLDLGVAGDRLLHLADSSITAYDVKGDVLTVAWRASFPVADYVTVPVADDTRVVVTYVIGSLTTTVVLDARTGKELGLARASYVAQGQDTVYLFDTQAGTLMAYAVSNSSFTWRWSTEPLAGEPLQVGNRLVLTDGQWLLGVIGQGGDWAAFKRR